jgi:prolyl 4-hydroxylase
MRQIFSDDWKIWIWTNVASGQDKNKLFKIMMDAGFIYGDIVNELSFQPQASATEMLDLPSPAMGEAYVEALPKNAIQQIILPHALKLDSDLVDLHLVDNFLEPVECEALIETMQRELIPATVVTLSKGSASLSSNRSNKSCSFTSNKTALVKDINLRICNYLGISEYFSESMQGQFYQEGDEFKPHVDYFDDAVLKPKMIGPGGQRTISVVIFLNDVLDGGALEFPSINQSIVSKSGRLVIWNNLKINGDGNPFTRHQGMPVIKGYKAILTKFFRSEGAGDMMNTGLFPKAPAYTLEGFSKAKIPGSLFRQLQRFNNDNTANFKEEIVEGFISGQGNSGTTLLASPQQLSDDIHKQLQPLLEKWSGIELQPTSVYGIRQYLRGAQLKMHRDRQNTHIISAVLNIAQDIDEDWYLHIDDHFFRRHKVSLLPGEMLFYEGASLAHGRPEPLKGRSYNNIFVHYQPRTAK